MLRHLWLAAALPYMAWSASDQQIEFNRDIRPILSDKCFACHGPDAGNRKTKLRFDQESGARIALRDGKYAIVPGNAAKSELIRRVASDNKAIRMPPAYAGHNKLSEREIDLLRRWIEQGAKWQAHWAFIPPKRPIVPEVKEKVWTRNPIDYFVAQRLEREGLTPSAETGRHALIRRVSLDLTGLPPTPAEVDAFVKDRSSDAYEKVVDRLLASPRYGERMAYRWMEAARYADTNGYQSDGMRDMWRWRDWVIDAFNKNMPYDQFTIEQLAGDLLPHPTLEQRIATAFNRNHRTSAEGGIVPEEFRVEYVADRAETTSIVWLGLTIGCARCHDHKYDPIKQKDFYRLFAYFNNVPEQGLVYNFGNDEPYIKAPTPEQAKTLQEWDKKVTAAERKYQSLQPKQGKAQQKWEKKVAQGGNFDWTINENLVFRQQTSTDEKAAGCEKGSACEVPLVDGPSGKARQFDGKRYIEVTNEKDIGNFDYLDPFTFAAWVNPKSPNGVVLSRYEDYFEGAGHGLYLIDGKVRLHLIFRWTDIGLRVETKEPIRLNEWQHVSVTYDGKRKAAGVKVYVNGKPREVRILLDYLGYPMKAKRPFRIGAGGGMHFQGMIADARVYRAALSPEEAATLAVRESISEIAAMPAAVRTKAQSDKLRLCFEQQFASQKFQQVRRELAKIRKGREQYYASIPTVMVMEDSPEPRDTFVLQRGAYDAHGEKVTPGVPGVLPQLPANWPNSRLGLARWLVDRENPLTARVTVNRFWQMYFGTGLVKTVDDFGSQGEWPTHPELLDWLAVAFMESGWNVKALQKKIVMSATYRQSSQATEELRQKDPENRLLARGPRLRLGPEMIRDQALAASGLLVEKLGGPSVKPYQPPGLWQELAGGKGYEPDKGEGLYRRSLYTFWRRTVAPPFMVTFDSPNRETCTVRENRTNTPLQALNLMNDEMFLEASRKLAERMIFTGGESPESRIQYAYRAVLMREPSQKEVNVLKLTLADFEMRYQKDGKAAEQYLSYGDSSRSKNINAPDLAAYTIVASLIFNLDEAVTKQ